MLLTAPGRPSTTTNQQADRRLRSVARALQQPKLGAPPTALARVWPGGAGSAGGAAASPSSSPFPSAATALGIVPTHDCDEAVRQLYEHGVCVLAGVLPALSIAALRDAAVSTAKRYHGGAAAGKWSPAAPGEQPSEAEADPTWNIPGIFSIDADWPTQQFVEHVAGERVLAVLDEVFDTTPGDYRVHSSTVQVNKPFCDQAGWHTDSWISQRGYCRAPHESLLRTGYVNALWMLSGDFHTVFR